MTYSNTLITHSNESTIILLRSLDDKDPLSIHLLQKYY